MDHLAILNKKLNLLQKIISGEKTIESRWYVNKKAPYGCIKKGDIVYFKNSGEPVSVKTVVGGVLQFDNLNNDKILQILKEYGKRLGVDESYASNIGGKKYCVLIFLENVKEIKQFDIDKKGYGMMSAWISVDNIVRIKK
jgi:ASC-1-like (ASCH) protein